MKKIRLQGPAGTGTVPLLYDCPWFGHLADPRVILRNSSAPNVVGQRCIKCGCMVYDIIEAATGVVGADGAPLATA